MSGTEVPEPRRGWVLLYGLSFVFMMAAGTVLVIASLGSLSSIRLLRFSAVLSAAAIVAAVLSVVVQRRP